MTKKATIPSPMSFLPNGSASLARERRNIEKEKTSVPSVVKPITIGAKLLGKSNVAMRKSAMMINVPGKTPLDKSQIGAASRRSPQIGRTTREKPMNIAVMFKTTIPTTGAI
jgi:hypothetical protein